MEPKHSDPIDMDELHGSRSNDEFLDDYEEVAIGPGDRIKQIAWKIKRSVSFIVLYVFLILLNLFVLVWEITKHENKELVITLEFFINLMFVIEIGVEMITQ